MLSELKRELKAFCFYIFFQDFLAVTFCGLFENHINDLELNKKFCRFKITMFSEKKFVGDHITIFKTFTQFLQEVKTY